MEDNSKDQELKSSDPNPQLSEEAEPKKVTDGLFAILIGLVIVWVAYYFYNTMTDYEAGYEIEMNVILLFAYKIFGKLISSILIGIIGLLVIFSGISDSIAAIKEK